MKKFLLNASSGIGDIMFFTRGTGVKRNISGFSNRLFV